MDAFSLDAIEDRKFDEYGGIYWTGRVASRLNNQTVSVAVHCIGAPGQSAAAGAAERLYAFARQRLTLLVGIAAGRRGKCRIGDIVIASSIVDYTHQALTKQGALMRPKIPVLSFSVVQMLGPWLVDGVSVRAKANLIWPEEDDLPELLQRSFEPPVIHHAAIASGDLLLRDDRFLESMAARISDTIRAGEMEAAGMVRACESRMIPLPWLVVRAVSDYGDHTKSDEFQLGASRVAATYATLFAEECFDRRGLRQ